jgi:plasmid stabilization system protein ParE
MKPRRLILTPEAFDDIRAARSWYEQRREGLGAAFDLALEATLMRLQRMPEAHPLVAPPFRRAVVRRFPYEVFYRLDADTAVIVLVFHTAQDPTRALSRLRQH